MKANARRRIEAVKRQRQQEQREKEREKDGLTAEQRRERTAATSRDVMLTYAFMMR